MAEKYREFHYKSTWCVSSHSSLSSVVATSIGKNVKVNVSVLKETFTKKVARTPTKWLFPAVLSVLMKKKHGVFSCMDMTSRYVNKCVVTHMTVTRAPPTVTVTAACVVLSPWASWKSPHTARGLPGLVSTPVLCPGEHRQSVFWGVLR